MKSYKLMMRLMCMLLLAMTAPTVSGLQHAQR